MKAGENTDHPHKTIKVVGPEMNNDVVFLGYDFERRGAVGANDFVSRSSIGLKRMTEMLSYHQQDGNRGELTLCSPQSLSSIAPSPFFDSCRWAALHGNMALSWDLPESARTLT